MIPMCPERNTVYIILLFIGRMVPFGPWVPTIILKPKKRESKKQSLRWPNTILREQGSKRTIRPIETIKYSVSLTLSTSATIFYVLLAKLAKV